MTVQIDTPRRAYEQPETVAFYADYDGAQPLHGAEQYLFERFVDAGSRVLDVGVGGGRTTGYLAGRALRYVGVDYSPAMVAAAQERHPGRQIEFGDATDLAQFASGSFDVVVFSFNGIDSMQTDPDRSAALSEFHRVLAERGVLILSRHNPRNLLAPKRKGPASRKVAMVRVARRARRSARVAFGAVRTHVFWRGTGYYDDAVHGGIRQAAATPSAAIAEIEGCGFRRISGPHAFDAPSGTTRFRMFSTPWYYLAFERQNRSDPAQTT